LPAARLQPLEVFDPDRILTLLEEDPSLIEPGLRLAGRDIPLPDSAGGGSVQALCVDAAGRAAGVWILGRLSAGDLGACMAARQWIEEALPTLRAVSPSLKGNGAEVRCLILTGRVDPSAAALLASVMDRRPTVLEIALFESPDGIAVNVRPAAGEPGNRPAVPRQPSTPPGADPLTAIPLTSEEASEFRRLVDARPQGPAPRAEDRAAAPERIVAEGALARDTFLEN